MQKLTTCGNCGQQVYVETDSQLALACPTCNSVLAPATPPADSHKLPLGSITDAPNPYAENPSAFSELTPLADDATVAPQKSYEPMDSVMTINENANKKLLMGLLVGAIVLTVLIVGGLVVLLAVNRTTESRPAEKVAQEDKADFADTHTEKDSHRDFVPAQPEIEFDTLPHLSSQVSAKRDLQYEWHPLKPKKYKFDFKMSHGSEEIRINGTNQLTLSRSRVSNEFGSNDLSTEGTGTCFFVHPDGLAVTCAHVVEGSQVVQIKFGGRWLPAGVVAIDAQNDLALIRIRQNRVPFLQLKETANPELEQKVHVIGYPIQDILGSSVKFTSGAITHVDAKDGASEIHFDAIVNPGNSGGPVIDQTGDVIAVASAMFQGEGFRLDGLGVQSDKVIDLLRRYGVSLPRPKRSTVVNDNSVLAKKTTPSVCLVKATGRKNAKVLDFESEVNMSVGKSPETSTTYKGKLLVEDSGEVIDAKDGGGLSVLLVSPSTTGLEKMDLYGGESWQHRDVAIILKPGEQKKQIDFRGMTPRRRFGLPQVTREMRSGPESVVGLVTTSYSKRKSSDPNIAFYIIKRSINSLDQVNQSNGYFRSFVQGSMVFDKRKKCITELRMTGTMLTRIDGNLRNYLIRHNVDLDEGDESLPKRSTNKDKKDYTPVRSKVTDTKAKTVDAETENLHADIQARFDKITWGVKGFDFLQRGDRLFLAVGKSNGLVVYDWKNRKMTDSLERVTSAASGMVVTATPNGQKILFGVRYGTIQIYDLSDEGVATKSKDVELHKAEVRFIKVAADGNTVLSGDSAKQLRIWTIDGSRPAKVFNDFSRGLRDAVLTDNNEKAFVFDGQAVYRIDLKSGEILSMKKFKFSNDEGSFSPDGKLFAHRHLTDKMTIYESDGLKPLIEFKCRVFPRFLRFSPDSKQLFWGTHGWAHYMNLEQKEQFKFKVHKTFGLENIIFTPDGKECAIATGASSGEVVILKRPSF